MEKLDKLGVEEALRKFPQQLGEAWSQVQKQDLPKISASQVLISGMGGSSFAGRIIAGLFEEKLAIPIIIHNDYGLPGWVNNQTLVVVNSYSGNTEETLSSVESAQKVGAKILGLATGGKLGEKIKSGQISGAILAPTTNPTNFPKTGLGVSLGGLLALLSKTGVVPQTEDEFNLAITNLNEIRSNWLPVADKSENQAKQLADWFLGNFPVIVGSRPLLGAVQAARNIINELARTFALWFDLPELDHHLVEATLLPQEAKSKLRYLFFLSNFSLPRVKLRYQLTQEVFSEQGLTFKQIDLRGQTPLAQALELAHLCTWVSFYLSLLNQVDPGPEPWIIKLKEKLQNA